MKLLDHLEKKFGRYALPNVTVYLIAGQTLFYVLYFTGKLGRGTTLLAADLLLEGEWWRLATFPFDPPVSSPIFALFAWYFFYLMGTAIEGYWGAFRYNVYLLVGYVLTVAAAFLVPAFPVTNAFIAGSVFLAFAALYPEFVIYIFFVLPLKVKWLAVATWAYYGYLILAGSWSSRVMVLASIGNFLLFFARDIRWLVKSGHRQMARQVSQTARRPDEPFHRCTTCGITDKTHPRMDFRYCPQCDGQYGYCQEHIFSHEHVKKG
jgi:hypothetical protein